MMRTSVLAILALTALLSQRLTGPASAADRPIATRLDCAYWPRHGKEITTFEDCARVDAAGALHLTPKHLRALRYDRHGLASLWLGASFYYAAHDGRLAPVMTMDNWADDFFDGLARSPRDGKVGYVDRRLRLAIPASYDGAYPFDHGRAVVCRGCVSERNGEYHNYAGGSWGCIDTHGREVVPLTHRSLGDAGC
jgi:hypothetical protein